MARQLVSWLEILYEITSGREKDWYRPTVRHEEVSPENEVIMGGRPGEVYRSDPW